MLLFRPLGAPPRHRLFGHHCGFDVPPVSTLRLVALRSQRPDPGPLYQPGVCYLAQQFNGPFPASHDCPVCRTDADCCILLWWLFICALDVRLFPSLHFCISG